MSGKRLLCLVVSLALSFVVIFALAGGIAPGFAASTIGQIVLAAAAAVIGLIVGNMAQQRFFPRA